MTTERPEFPVHQREKERITAEAKQREIERAEVTLRILQEQAAKSDDSRQAEKADKTIERQARTEEIESAKSLVKAAQKLNIITKAGVFFSFLSFLAVAGSVWYARDATIEANRAWVIFDSPRLIVQYITPQRPTFDASLRWFNNGNGPAAEAKSHLEPFWYRPIVDDHGVIDMNKQHFPPNDICGVVNGTNDRGTIWPNEPPGSNLINMPTEPPPDFYQSRALYAFHGCTTYRVFGEIKQTRICEFLTPTPGKPFSRWNWSFCPGPGQNDAS